MSWPKSLKHVTSRTLNSTEIWMLKERMTGARNYEIVSSSGFAEYSSWTIRFDDTGEEYSFEAFTETIDGVEKL